MLLYVHKDHKGCIIRDREHRTATSTFTQRSTSMLLYVHKDHKGCIIRDREHRTATSTFTQLLCSVFKLQRLMRQDGAGIAQWLEHRTHD